MSAVDTASRHHHMLEQTHSLSAYLRNQKEAILESWCRVARQDDSLQIPLQSSGLSYQDFLDDIPHLLTILCAYLEGKLHEDALDDSAEDMRRHARERWKQNFNLEEMLRDLGDLQQVVLEAVNRFFDASMPGADSLRTDAIRQTSSFFTEAICASAARFDELQRGEASQKIEELEQMGRYLDQIGTARKNLISDVSHDISGSLTAISGVSELLKKEPVESQESVLPEFGTIIEECVASANRVLDSLLQIANLDAYEVTLELKWIELEDFLSECFREVAVGEKIKRELFIDLPGKFTIYADPEKLKRTVDALIDTALVDTALEAFRIECKAMEDAWTLRLVLPASSAHKNTRSEEIARRREIDYLLLKRLCFIQKATCRVEHAQSKEGNASITLKFPKDHDKKKTEVLLSFT